LGASRVPILGSSDQMDTNKDNDPIIDHLRRFIYTPREWNITYYSKNIEQV